MAALKERKHSEKHSHDTATRSKRQPGVLKRKGRGGGRRVLTWALLGFITIIITTVALYSTKTSWKSSRKPRVITPLPVERVIDLPQFQGTHKEHLYWGTYRPHVYLGLRTRSQKSLLVGLMWLGVKDGYYVLRHVCDNGNGLTRYGWLRHDGETYGRQEILDRNFSITTSFLKHWDERSGYGGDWAVRINVVDISKEKPKPRKRISLFFYIADEEGKILKIWPEQSTDGPFVAGFKHDVGQWQMHMHGGKKGASINFAGFKSLHMHNISELVQQALQLQAFQTGHWQLPDASELQPNIAVLQISGQVPLELDIVFVSGLNGTKGDPVQNRVANLAGTRLGVKLEQKDKAFEARFETTFSLKERVDSLQVLEVAKAALSNLLGGIGYFFGESKIAIPRHLDLKGRSYLLYWPASLFTAVPCRSVFPRGFLWDEGFHQMIISKWNRHISYDIIGHWLDLINIDGWIPREQILGSEARSKVPDEFVLQYSDNGNPPTLFLALHDIARSYITGKFQLQEKEEVKFFLKRCFPRLEAWFTWFNSTQIGRSPGTYFWHGREPDTDKELNAKTLSSGLDDYPRASHPSMDERHLDLRCWMVLAAKCMDLIAQIVEAPSEVYQKTGEMLSDIKLLNELHYDHSRGHYYDYGNHTEKVTLQWENSYNPQTGEVSRVLRRVALQRPKLQLVRHFGYVSLFPFIMKLIPSDSSILEKHLQFIRDEDLLWTSFGLRSLSTTSSLYMKHNTEHDPPYWRGTVWINLNYMVLSALHFYSRETGPYQNSSALLYAELRSNLIRNIVQRYDESGYLWEQYDNLNNGVGRGAHPFTGWTSLILLIIAEAY